MKRKCVICRLSEGILRDINSRLSYMSSRKLSDYVRRNYGIDISYITFLRHSRHKDLKEEKIEEKEHKKEHIPKLVFSAKILSRDERDRLEAYSLVYGKQRAREVLGY